MNSTRTVIIIIERLLLIEASLIFYYDMNFSHSDNQSGKSTNR